MVDQPLGSPPDVVSLTALAVAAGRAVESSRPDPLLHDPFAAPLVESLLALAPGEMDLPTAWPADPDSLSPRHRRLLVASAYIGVRTRFVDDYLAGLQPGAEPVPEVDLPRQVVILGAGLDTRAFRLDWPGRTEVFELDHTEVLVHKRDVLRELGAGPRCEWFAVPTDFEHAWDYALIAAGFDRRRRTTWIVDDVLSRLPADAQRAVVSTVARLSVPGSRVVIGQAVPAAGSPDLDEKLRLFAHETGLPVDGLLARANPPDPAQLLRDHDWTVQEHSLADLAQRYGRSLVDQAAGGADDDDAPHAVEAPGVGGFITAQLPVA